ncbi:hypothetical protein EMIT0111MI5_280026 [Burkholderia sp. IT-111MI5]
MSCPLARLGTIKPPSVVMDSMRPKTGVATPMRLINASRFSGFDRNSLSIAIATSSCSFNVIVPTYSPKPLYTDEK